MTSNDTFSVLIAVDKSEHAENALNFYCSCIHKDGFTVYLVHVLEEPSTATLNHKCTPATIEEWQRLMEKEARETEELYVKYLLKLRQAKILGVYKTFYGKPGEALCTAALELQARLVVIGTRGLGSVRRTILGSVSDYVLHHAHVPVVICRH